MIIFYHKKFCFNLFLHKNFYKNFCVVEICLVIFYYDYFYYKNLSGYNIKNFIILKILFILLKNLYIYI